MLSLATNLVVEYEVTCFLRSMSLSILYAFNDMFILFQSQFLTKNPISCTKHVRKKGHEPWKEIKDEGVT